MDIKPTRVRGTSAGYLLSLVHKLGTNCPLPDRPTRSYDLTAADFFLCDYIKCIGPVHEPMMNCGQLLNRWDIGHVNEDTRELSRNWEIRWKKHLIQCSFFSYIRIYIYSFLRYVCWKVRLDLETLCLSNWQDILCHCCSIAPLTCAVTSAALLVPERM
jgi:hypothetical protein